MIFLINVIKRWIDRVYVAYLIDVFFQQFGTYVQWLYLDLVHD